MSHHTIITSIKQTKRAAFLPPLPHPMEEFIQGKPDPLFSIYALSVQDKSDPLFSIYFYG
tara:strand:+ start:233 stop:412 length:180 start_codon:yes stop_codon:yes gene_type:complete